MASAPIHAASFARQSSFSGMCPIEEAVQQLSQSGAEARGAIYTRREVVEFILDLVGYTEEAPLYERSLLEPAFGGGDFLLVAVERLLRTWNLAGREQSIESLRSCIRAVELHTSSFVSTQGQLIDLLMDGGVGRSDAALLADEWLVQGDFLLADLPGAFDYVVGNPPYVRQELIPAALIEEYRSRYSTIYDRADIYIPFIERSLNLLSASGALGFICADRWMKNRYGSRLREMVSRSFHLKFYVDMVDTPAFHSDVIAYPAITVISRDKPAATRMLHRPKIEASNLRRLASRLRDRELLSDGEVKEVARVTDGAQPWVLESSDQLALLRRLESDFPLIEEAGCKVGIGVATGADKAFIGPYEELDVEDDRKLPIAMTRDIVSGEVAWRGFGIVNPFAERGGLVDLDDFPRLKRYLEDRKDQIAKRHVAQKAPANWYRTIDRIYPALASRPKLLIPDIKGQAHIVFENDGLYPHHNLYFIISDEWDLRALRAVLLSGIARLFVATYSTRMRGGYLRFQAQYLRRIRLPRWCDVSVALQDELISAAATGDLTRCNIASFELYGLSAEERTALGGNGEQAGNGEGGKYGDQPR